MTQPVAPTPTKKTSMRPQTIALIIIVTVALIAGVIVLALYVNSVITNSNKNSNQTDINKIDFNPHEATTANIIFQKSWIKPPFS